MNRSFYLLNLCFSYEEFLAETQRDEYNKDEGWDTLDEADDMFTEEEFNNFEQQRQQEVQQMMQMGQLPQGYPYPNIPGMPPVGFGHPGGYPAGAYPQPHLQPGQQFGPPMPGNCLDMEAITYYILE